MNERELNDELCAIGEAILGQMADEHGRETADEKFHEWNDTVYDICHRAFERDKKGVVDISPNDDPRGFMQDAYAKDLVGLEQRIEELAYKAFNTWREARRSGKLLGYSGVPTIVNDPYAAAKDPYAPLPSSHSASYMQIACNVPEFLRDEEAKFLITAQVREALLK